MGKLASAIRKELLVLSRDLPGLLILFIMPLLLIMIVALAQENAIRSSSENRTEILIVDRANSVKSKAVIRDLQESSFFTIVTTPGGIIPDGNTARELISNGEYRAGLEFCPGDSAILLILDPALQQPYKSNLAASVHFVVKAAQGKLAMSGMVLTMTGGNEQVAGAMVKETLDKLTPVIETYAFREPSTINPTLMENDIPGFILFAIFFIVLPLSGNMIGEKHEGSFKRLLTTPVPVGYLLSAKVIVYLMVGMVQFLLMLCMGTLVLPEFFGLPRMETGDEYFAIAVTSISCILAAIGLGLLIGSLFTTQGQSASFGSVLVVILGVISGTFLPVYLMPDFIRAISLVSPIRWGIESYLDLFIRQGNLLTVLPYIFLLLFFFGFAMMISIAIFVRKN